MTEITGVILAAGQGTRMVPFSDKYPKPLLPVCNKPLIQYQIEAMRDLVGIKKILIVIGHLGFQIVQALNNGNKLGVEIEYVEQKETKGIAHALGQLESRLHDPFFLFLGDIFFIAPDLQKMLDSFSFETSVAAVLATRHGESAESIKKNFSVLVKDGRVNRVIEKPHFPLTDIKGCGLYLFNEHIFDAIRRTPRTAARDEYELTESIQILIDDGLPVMEAHIVVDDINLTTPPDLLRCNMVMREHLGSDLIVGRNVKIADGQKIHRSIIGDNVEIISPISISDCLVFPDTLIKHNHSLDHVIVTPERSIDCRPGI